MKIAEHIPAYLLCERLKHKGKILDLYPPDEQGLEILAGLFDLAVVVHRSAQDLIPKKGDKIERIIANPDKLPFSKGNYDLVMIVNPDSGDGVSGLGSLIKAARGLINPAGHLIVQIPNSEARGIDTTIQKGYPDFLDFERTLRKHFPHVALFSKQPFFGGVVTPLGRRSISDNPILDDRLLPTSGETADHFIALCSTKFIPTGDTIIARLPFQILAEQVRSKIEKLEGAVSIIKSENDAHKRNLEISEKQVDALQNSLSETRSELRNRAAMSSNINRLEEALRQRERLLAEAEESLEKQQTDILAKSEQLHAAERRIRALEKLEVTLQHKENIASEERIEADAERRGLMTSFHESQSNLNSKQREIDDLMERLAGMEAEMSSILKEASNQRRDLIQSREQNRSLSIKINELEHSSLSDTSHDAEMERLRTQIHDEKQRIEKQLEQTHHLLLDEIAAKETSRREVHKLEVELKEATLNIQTIKSQTNGFIETRERLAQQNTVENDRLGHAIELLEKRAIEAEKKAAIMERRSSELHEAVIDAEDLLIKMKESEITVAAKHQNKTKSLENKHSVVIKQLTTDHTETLEQLESANATIIQRLDKKQAELARLRPSADAAHASKLRAEMAEATVSKLNHENEKIDQQLQDTITKTQKIKHDLAMATTALADNKEDARTMDQTVAKRIKEMKVNIARLTRENKTELLAVRNDLELELRHSNAQLEARQGELWELREENIRLQALMAATVATVNEESGARSDLQQTLVNQENLISKLTDERNDTRKQCEKLTHSLESRKKNLKILAKLLRKERKYDDSNLKSSKSANGDPTHSSKESPNIKKRIDIEALIVEVEKNIDTDLTDLDDDQDRTIEKS